MTKQTRETTVSITTTETGENASVEILPLTDGTDLMSELSITGKAAGSEEKKLVLTSKWAGETSKFELDFIDDGGNALTLENHGVLFTTEDTQAGAGLVNITDALSLLTEDKQITRVLSQFNDDATLDRLQNYFQGFRDSMIAQYVLCYTGSVYPESETVKGTVDVASLITKGNARREDGINVLIAGDYGDLRPLEYEERDQLLKAGISNLELKVDGGYRIGDLCTFYHPVGITNPLYRFDRNVTLLGNIAFDFMSVFRDSEAWASVILVSEDDFTVNSEARTLKDIKGEVNTRLKLYAKNAWIADVETAMEATVVEIDSENPDRVNINAGFDLSGVGRIFDITNFVGFYYGSN